MSGRALDKRKFPESAFRYPASGRCFPISRNIVLAGKTRYLRTPFVLFSTDHFRSHMSYLSTSNIQIFHADACVRLSRGVENSFLAARRRLYVEVLFAGGNLKIDRI